MFESTPAKTHAFMAWSLQTACRLSLPSCCLCKCWAMCSSGCRAMKPLSCSVWVLGSARHTSWHSTGNAGGSIDTASLGRAPTPPDTSHLHCSTLLETSPPNLIKLAFSPVTGLGEGEAEGWKSRGAGGLCSLDFKLGTFEYQITVLHHRVADK